MDRCALFVDAGYLLGDGAMAVHGTRHRETVSWDFGGLLQLLGTLARERTGIPLLRCYWYECTVEGQRGPEHETLADLPGLKLRLARARPGRREGVDNEIHRDLMTLARNGALADAVVISGDEDIAQVVVDAQDLGVRVTVVHVALDGNLTVSRSLRQECDDLIEVAAGQLRPYVNLLSGVDTSGGSGASAPAPLSNGHGPGHNTGHSPSHGTSHGTSHSTGPGMGAFQANGPVDGPPPSSPVTGSLPPLGASFSSGTGGYDPGYGSSSDYGSGPSSGYGSNGSTPALGNGSHDYGSGYGSGNGSFFGMDGGGPPQQQPPPPSQGHTSAPMHAAPTPNQSNPGYSTPDYSNQGHSNQGHSSTGHSTTGPLPGPSMSGPSAGPSTTGPSTTGPTATAPSAPSQPGTGPQYLPSSPVQPPSQPPPSPPPGPYTGPQQISPVPAQQAAPTLADAVKAAHQEGQDFGESVARDAPALWLEAVLARKPRMPSDLEARLLQGSSLPIDFLLHDEVRHALRRGFWDALERSRR